MAKAFDESIKRKGLAGPGGVQLLIGHDWNKVGGKIKKLETVDDKLMLEAQLYMDVSYVKDVHTVLKQNGGLEFLRRLLAGRIRIQRRHGRRGRSVADRPEGRPDGSVRRDISRRRKTP